VLNAKFLKSGLSACAIYVATPDGGLGLAALANDFAGPSAAKFRQLLLLVRSFLAISM